MKLEEKNLARELRKHGWSLNEIREKVKVSKSSVSIWVRDIELTDAQKQKLSKKGVSKEIIEKQRSTRLKRENARRQNIIDNAKRDIRTLSKNDLFLVGVALYWAEGGKTGGVVRLSNGDPRIIQVTMRFLRKICGVPEKKFRGYIHIHPHLDHKRAEKYWSEVSGIPRSQFYKTYRKPNISSLNKKDSLPFGTFDVYVCNTELFLKIKGWTEKVHELVIQKSLLQINKDKV